MGIRPLEPYGRALADYHAGDAGASLTVHSDLGEHDPMPVSIFFRGPDELYPFEQAALEHVRGRVLDLGAGAGVHALIFQERGHDVTAIDVVPQAVEVMRSRGVRDARCADYLAPDLDVDPADTVIMLMNGPGPCGTLDGLSRYLSWAAQRLRPGGQIILDSGAVQRPDEAAATDGAFTWPERESDYAGEAWIRLEYKGAIGEAFRELYVDRETLTERAAAEGWNCRVLREDEHGYVVSLRRVGGKSEGV